MNRAQVLWLTRSYEVRKRREAVLRWIAWRLPRELVMWCYMRVAAHATTGKHGNNNACDVLMMDAIKWWDDAAH